jgi:hypothetical protein
MTITGLEVIKGSENQNLQHMKKKWEDQEPAEDVEDRHLRNMGGAEIRGRDLELGTVLKL